MSICSRERHWRVAIFFGGTALAGAFGGMPSRLGVPILVPRLLCAGVFAYAIGNMDGVGGKRGWQWCVFHAAHSHSLS